MDITFKFDDAIKARCWLQGEPRVFTLVTEGPHIPTVGDLVRLESVIDSQTERPAILAVARRLFDMDGGGAVAIFLTMADPTACAAVLPQAPG